MAAFSLLLRKVNRDILFFSRSRLPFPGMRYAPQTFLTEVECRVVDEVKADCLVCLDRLLGDFLFLHFKKPVYFAP
jgi:hypothetical protein